MSRDRYRQEAEVESRAFWNFRSTMVNESVQDLCGSDVSTEDMFRHTQGDPWIAPCGSLALQPEEVCSAREPPSEKWIAHASGNVHKEDRALQQLCNDNSSRLEWSTDQKSGMI